MQNYKGPGETLTLVAPYTVVAGAGALVGAIFGVAYKGVTSGASGEFLRSGEFTLAKLTTDVWEIGQRLYWDDSNKRLDEDSTVGPFVAIALEVTTSSSTTGRCVLVGAPPAGSEGPQAAVADTAAASGACAGGAEPSATNVNTAIATAVAPLVVTINALLAALRLYPVIKT